MMGDLNPQQFRFQLAMIVTDPEFLDRAVMEYAARWEAKKALLKAQVKSKGKAPVVAVEPEPAKTPAEIEAERWRDASAKLLAAMELERAGQDARTPAKLIWRQASLDMIPHWHTRQNPDAYRAKEYATPAVVRDPCPKCGTRMDHGCKHYPAGY